MDSEAEPQLRVMRPGAVVGGAIMLVVGGTMLLDTTGVFDVSLRQLIGPFVLITIGTLMLIEKRGFLFGRCWRTADGQPDMRRRRRGGVTGGIWLIGIGGVMLLAQTHAFGLDAHNSWPLFIVLSGLIMLIRGVR